MAFLYSFGEACTWQCLVLTEKDEIKAVPKRERAELDTIPLLDTESIGIRRGACGSYFKIVV